MKDNNYNEENKANIGVEVNEEVKTAEETKVKRTSKSLIAIIILSILLVCALGYICYNEFIKNDNAKEEKIEKEDNKTNIKEEAKKEDTKIEQKEEIKKEDNITNKEEKVEVKTEKTKVDPIFVKNVQDAMDIFKFLAIDDKVIYNNNFFNINDISEKELIRLAIKAVIRENGIKACYSGKRKDLKGYSIEQVNSYLNKYIETKKISLDMFNKEEYPPLLIVEGEEVDYGLDDFGIIVEGNNLKFVASCGNEGYGEGNEFYTYDFIEKKVVKAEIEGENLYIYEKVIFAEEKGKNIYPDGSPAYQKITALNFYKDIDKTQLVKETDGSCVLKNEYNCIENEFTEKCGYDLNDFYSYKYTFKMKNGNYYFKTIEIVK